MERGEVHGIMANGWGGPTTEAMVQLHRDRTRQDHHPARTGAEAGNAGCSACRWISSPATKTGRSWRRCCRAWKSAGRSSRRPDIPADRLAMLRNAFDKAAADPELVAEANRTQLYVNPMTGAQSQAVIERIYATPPAITRTHPENVHRIEIAPSRFRRRFDAVNRPGAVLSSTASSASARRCAPTRRTNAMPRRLTARRCHARAGGFAASGAADEPQRSRSIRASKSASSPWAARAAATTPIRARSAPSWKRSSAPRSSRPTSLPPAA